MRKEKYYNVVDGSGEILMHCIVRDGGHIAFVRRMPWCSLGEYMRACHLLQDKGYDVHESTLK